MSVGGTSRICGRVAALVMLSALAACAPRGVTPAPPVTAPAYPQFPYPAVTDDLARAAGPIAADHEHAWNHLQAGRTAEAARSFQHVLAEQATFYPAEAGLGFTELAEDDPDAALAHFDRALARAPSYAPALIGRGETLLALNRDRDALAAYEAALEADPSLTDARKRIEVIRFRAVQADVKTAQEAQQRGDLAQARAHYQRAIAATPDSSFLYRDLAEVERSLGDVDQALVHVERALVLDPHDAISHQTLGQIREQRGELVEAVVAYRRAAELDPTLAGDLDRRVETLEGRRELAALPEAYRAIPGRVSITRGDLAAMLGIRLASVLTIAPQGSVLVTDARRHWARSWILAVAQSRVMEVSPNHTFQPDARLTRDGLALAASRVLALIERRAPGVLAAWTQARQAFSDMSPNHVHYAAASQAVAAGVMRVGQDAGFTPRGPVSGGEAVAAVERLAELAEQAGLDVKRE